MIEVEKKGWIRDPKAMLETLNEKGRFIKDCRKEDIYYNLPSINETGKLISQESKIFRIRQSEGKQIVTYKIKSIREGAEVSVEEEFLVDDRSAFQSFAEYLGYQKLIEKTKLIKLFKYK
ncbi:MAG TPA: class IV adenylate cyclase, partial [Spirochaetes bacterium]|nr:class IV adenylate cyclase [Spirochaetota bacterium]